MNAPLQRFVILFHQTPKPLGETEPQPLTRTGRENHLDLMFEWNDQLWTWAVPSSTFEPGRWLAVELPRHRLEYLTYEGPLSRNRGQVRRILSGTFAVACSQPRPESLPELVRQGQFGLELSTEGLRYHLEFLRITHSKSTDPVEWDLVLTAATR